jgi:hypothetical protein
MEYIQNKEQCEKVHHDATTDREGVWQEGVGTTDSQSRVVMIVVMTMQQLVRV